MLIITEGNKDLKNRVFPLPDGIRRHLMDTLQSYNGDKTSEGYKRLNNILSMEDGIRYNEMKRIKNFFDTYRGTDKSDVFILNGGMPMKTWINNTLGTATKTIKDRKEALKTAGISNAYIKPHSKQRKGIKPTMAKVQTKNMNKSVANNNTLRLEHKDADSTFFSKIRSIVETVVKDLNIW